MNQDQQEELDGWLDTKWDAMMQTARIDGQKRPEWAWLLTDQDVWVKNPCYVGPAVPHPEWKS
jgi:hypothetical protein